MTLSGRVVLAGCVVMSLFFALCYRTAPPSPSNEARPATWGNRIEKPGVPNLHRISEDLYRGGQPTAEGFRHLKEMGIRTVVNLRSFHSDRDEMGNLDFDYVHIWAKAWHGEDEDVIKFLRVVSDPRRTPVFVHCMHGSDRTGTMVAAYRMVVQGWSREEAIEELMRGEYGFHEEFTNLVRYLRKLDVDEMRKAMADNAQ